MSLAELLKEHGDLTNQDLAALADWANAQKYSVPDPDWKKAFGLIREGADLLLRRRVRRAGEDATAEPIGTSMNDGRVRHAVTEATKGTL
jgi:hypothetical protein